MINKIVNDEKPEYMMVAFDIGKTFRHEKYERYKDGRKETPDDLKVQFPIAKKILAAMGIKYLECAGYEADDIIGTVSMWCEKDPEYEALIVSSDKDLLQLISDETTVKLLKTKDYIMMDRKTFNDTYGFEPIHMIDLKALMGDASDNIPGVRGIGEKGAIKLVSEYTTIENIYANINNIKGATQTKLIEGEDDAYYSKDLVTIYREVPLDVNFDDLKYKNCNIEELTNIYKELGFYSLLKKLDDVIEEDKKKEEHNSIDNFKVITDINEVKINEETAIWLDTTIGNYHDAELLGISLYNNNLAYYIPFDILKNNYNVLNTEFNLFTYDYKKLIVIFNRYGIKVPKIVFDTMISAYLLNYETKDDIAYLANNMNFNIHIYDKKEVLSDEEASKRAILKAKFIYTSKKEL